MNTNQYPLLLYSGKKVLQESGSRDINLNFLYLTKIDIPELLLFLDKNKVYYNTNTNNNKKTLTKIKSKLGHKEYISLTNKKLLELVLLEKKKIYSLPNIHKLITLEIPKLNTTSLNKLCQKNRVIKTLEEIDNIRKSCQLVSLAIKSMLQNLSNLSNIDEIVRHIKNYLLKKKIDEVAYTPICSTYNNSTTLHYNRLDSSLKNNPLILLDIGFKYQGYCSDITRTFPRTGIFSNNHKTIYQIVLQVNQDAIEKLKPGTNWSKIEQQAYLTIFTELEKIGLIKSNTLTKKEKISFVSTNLMYHSLGHFIGLYVHDVGNITILQKNMVLTVEPGIYFRETLRTNYLIDELELEKYIGIGGIRIEDTVLITEKGNEILNTVKGKPLAKTIEEIEKIVK